MGYIISLSRGTLISPAIEAERRRVSFSASSPCFGGFRRGGCRRACLGSRGAEATPRSGVATFPHAPRSARGCAPLHPLRGGQTPRLRSLGGQRGALPAPRACFRPPKEAEFASAFPSLKDRLTVSGGFAHATGACLPFSLNLAPAFAFGEEKISRLPPLLAGLKV